MMKSTYNVIGVMAGSSMDGLDVSYVQFQYDETGWNYEFIQGETLEYSIDLQAQLKDVSSKENEYLTDLDKYFGAWIGEKLNLFIMKHDFQVDLIAVHGHTAIHEPQNNISWQLGSGLTISTKTGITTITDFRTADIKLGGQGAPLVPMGDFNLFKQYDACLNLGGIANVSIRSTKMAWDITPCNQLLNFYAKKLGKEYDKDGELSRHGSLNIAYIEKLKNIEFFSIVPPKSLPNQFIQEEILNIVNAKDGLRSTTEFIAQQIALDTGKMQLDSRKMIVTGGGAHNHFLVERIKHHLSEWEIIIPSDDIINFKEAIVFGFLGILRQENKVNVLASVTGASKDSSSGVIHFAK